MTRDLLELSITHTKMGDTLFAAGRHEEALEAHRKSLAIREKLAAAEPRNVGRQQQLSMSYDAIGDVLVAAGRHEEAFDTYRKGLAIAERLAAADPGNADLRLELSVRYLHVGERLLEADPRDEVLEIYREGLAIAEKVDANPEWQFDLAARYFKIATALDQAERKDAARETLQKGIAIVERLAAAEPRNARWREASALFRQLLEILRDAPTARMLMAASAGDEPAVRKLIEEGADVNAILDDAMVRHATAGGADFGGADPVALGALRLTAVHMAAQAEHASVVRLLIEKGADVNAVAQEQMSALYMAASKGHDEVVRLLIGKGADAGAALHLAAEAGNQSAVRRLIENGANINAASKGRWTALHRAAASGDEAVARLLIEKGANVEAVDAQGCTALHYAAAMRGNEAIARLLIDNGADVTARDAKGVTPVDVARLAGRDDFAAFLVARSVGPSDGARRKIANLEFGSGVLLGVAVACVAAAFVWPMGSGLDHWVWLSAVGAGALLICASVAKVFALFASRIRSAGSAANASHARPIPTPDARSRGQGIPWRRWDDQTRESIEEKGRPVLLFVADPQWPFWPRLQAVLGEMPANGRLRELLQFYPALLVEADDLPEDLKLWGAGSSYHIAVLSTSGFNPMVTFDPVSTGTAGEIVDEIVRVLEALRPSLIS